MGDFEKLPLLTMLVWSATVDMSMDVSFTVPDTVGWLEFFMGFISILVMAFYLDNYGLAVLL